MRSYSRLKLRFRIWADTRKEPRDIRRRQAERFEDIVSFARDESEFYGSLYEHLPESLDDLDDVPPVTKSELMANFDGWVTDPEVERDELEAFVSDPSNRAEKYLGRYLAWRSSGTSGEPGLFLHDQYAITVYDLLNAIRGQGNQFLAELPPSDRMAAVVATGGNYATETQMERIRQKSPLHARKCRIYTVDQPTEELVAKLNEYRPGIIMGYPSAVRLLAEQHRSGRLLADPDVVVVFGERLTARSRRQISDAFECAITNLYGASEFTTIALECPSGNLHPNVDWVRLEPVDDEYEPVEYGEPSSSVLLTNLANRVQPIIRYDMGDSISLHPPNCDCGSSLPVLSIKGRSGGILRFAAGQSEEVTVLPRSIEAAVDSDESIGRFQLIQTAEDELTVRFDVRTDADRNAVWSDVRERLQAKLRELGANGVEVVRSDRPPGADSDSEKFQLVQSRVA